MFWNLINPSVAQPYLPLFIECLDRSSSLQSRVLSCVSQPPPACPVRPLTNSPKIVDFQCGQPADESCCPGHVRQARPMGLILLRLRSCARRSLCTTPLARAPRVYHLAGGNGTKRAAACAHPRFGPRAAPWCKLSSPSSTRCGFARRRPAAGYTLSSPFSTRTHSGMIQAARSKACLQSGSSQQPCASFASNQPHVLPHGEACVRQHSA